MFETHWTSHIILVSFPNTIPTFYEGNYNVTYELIQPLTQAIEIWNQAQAWFIQSYYPQNYPKDVFTLELASSGQTAQVTVQYVYTLPNGYWAETSQYGTKISMVISRAFQNSVLAAHELGHVLGLADNSIKGDLERSSGVYQPYPSTLDLYGVFLQAKCQCYTQQDSVGLPQQIPYSIWNPNQAVVPEFPDMPPVLVVGILVDLFLSVKLRRRVPTCNRRKHVPRV